MTDGTDEAGAPHRVFGIERWGKGLVRVGAGGDILLVDPSGGGEASLPGIVDALEARGIQTPVLIRVASFLEHGVRLVNEGFRRAIDETGYRGSYRGVFPIKVNQQAQVVRGVVEAGRRYDFGLEAGSKAELVVALSQPLPPGSLVICNGVKDEAFIRLAILSRRLGFTTFIVLESPREVDTVIRVAAELGEEPLLGIRIKLTNTIGGAWAASSGDRSTFGFNAEQLVSAIDRLREAGLLHCLRLQHSHLGSQIPDVNDVRRAVLEACRYFAALSGEGAPLDHLDLGGGLGIDYTGAMRAAESSVNYSIEEYCASVVETARYALDEAGLDHPVLVTESGRAVVALSAILVFTVLEATLYDVETAPEPQEGDHHLVADLAAVADYIRPGRLQEAINDATYYRDELRALFRRGHVDLRQVARGERIHLALMSRIRRLVQGTETSPEMAARLDRIADIYHCNFSLFQSLPDVWAIDQLHPVIPIQRLDEVPERRAILSDITCDSDGKIDRFVLADGIARSLPVHAIRDREPYRIGVFFVGAYQETLGDLHNLFGDTNVVTIRLREGGFDLVEEVEGDSIAEVLASVEYDPRACMDAFRRRVDAAISGGRLDAAEGRRLIRTFRESLDGYTYYE
jgi:arginine decarboxylase